MSKARDIADLDFNAPDIDGGNIDGAVIGATTAAAISGTTGQFDTSLNVDGTATMDGLATSLGIDVNGTDDLRVRFLNGGSFKAGVQVATTSGDMITNSAVNDLAIRSQGNILFAAGGSTERMRIDSDGRALYGTTDTTLYNNTSGNGALINGSGGEMQIACNNGAPMWLNRMGNDGEIIKFYRAGQTAGFIGGGDSWLAIGSGTGNVYFDDGLMAPVGNVGGASSNGVVDLGTTGRRFKDLYLSSNIYQGGSRKFVRVASNSGGSGIFGSMVDAPQTGIVHIYETGTDKYLIIACFKKQASSSPVTTVIANNGITVYATNPGGTIATAGYTTSGNVRMQATIYRET